MTIHRAIITAYLCVRFESIIIQMPTIYCRNRSVRTKNVILIAHRGSSTAG